MARNDTTSTATAAATKQYVTWGAANHFEVRRLTAADTKKLGAETGKQLVWDKGNDWRVERSEVPLNDEQLAAFLEADPAFKLVEG